MQSVTIYIGNLKYSRDEVGIQKLFERYGKVQKIEIIKDENERSKGFAFVQVPNMATANRAIEGMNGKIIDGRTLKVSIANDRFAENDQKKAFKPRSKKPEDKSSKKPIKKRKPKGLNVLMDYLKK